MTVCETLFVCVRPSSFHVKKGDHFCFKNVCFLFQDIKIKYLRVGDRVAKERLHRADLGGYDIGNFRFRWKNTIITIAGRL